jgi:methionyl-tRNA synthetase
LVRELHPFEDSDFTLERFKEAYNANLANGIGNLTNRILKMSEDNTDGISVDDLSFEFSDEYNQAFNEYNLQKASEIVWNKIGELDSKIQETEPFKLIKTDPESAKKIILELVEGLFDVAKMLEPILPETSEKILSAISENKKPEYALFNRID